MSGMGKPSGDQQTWVYRTAQDSWQAGSTSGSSGLSVEERNPIDLDLHGISDQQVFNFMPTALLNVNDDMSITTLTRFTTLSEGTPQTPTISGGQMTLAHPASGDKNTGLQEGPDIGICQVASSVNIVSRTGNAGNTYENVGVGIAKDSNNFILALWRRLDNLASIQVKIGGSANFRADVSATGWTPPFEIGFSMVANSLTMWRRVPGGLWTKITSYDVTSTINFKTSSLTGWKGVFWLATQSSQSVTFVFDDFKVGRFGSVGFRDPFIVSNEDGTARFNGSVVGLTATCTDPQAAAYCGVFTLDLVSRALTQTGVIMVNRSSSIQNDNATHLIAYDDGTYRMWITSWGNSGLGANTIQILYKNETSLNLLSGSNLVSGTTQLTMPFTGSGGAYDASVVKIGSTWYLAYIVGPSTPNTFFPALASSSDLSTWSLVGMDSNSFPYEGSRIVKLANQYWVLAATSGSTNVYDMTMAYQGKMNSLQVVGVNPPHPTLVPYGQYTYQVTFDTQLYSGSANTLGHFREFRARRYAVLGSGL